MEATTINCATKKLRYASMIFETSGVSYLPQRCSIPFKEWRYIEWPYGSEYIATSFKYNANVTVYKYE